MTDTYQSDIGPFGFPRGELRTCKACGWVHFPVTREYAERQVADFNRWYDELPPESKKHYSGHSSIAQYENCFRCDGSHHNMRLYDPSHDADIFGHTIQPIIKEAT